MNLMELFNSDANMQAVLTRIMTQRIRMRYRRDQVRDALQKAGHNGSAVTMGEIEALHYYLHPDDASRTIKANMTRSRKG
jgi:hypothetical protein